SRAGQSVAPRQICPLTPPRRAASSEREQRQTATALCGPRQARSGDYAPVASLTHFFVKLVLAAPCSFLSAAAVSQEACASFWHLPMKLVRAAPASFFSAAVSLQLGPAASALAA